jgi:hypothetical protein
LLHLFPATPTPTGVFYHFLSFCCFCTIFCSCRSALPGCLPLGAGSLTGWHFWASPLFLRPTASLSSLEFLHLHLPPAPPTTARFVSSGSLCWSNFYLPGVPGPLCLFCHLLISCTSYIFIYLHHLPAISTCFLLEFSGAF